MSSPPAEAVSKSAERRETASQILICVSLSDDTLGPKSMLFQKFVVHTRMLARRPRPSFLSACRNRPGDLRLVLPRALNDMLALGALRSVSLIARAGSLSIALLVPTFARICVCVRVTDSRVLAGKIPFTLQVDSCGGDDFLPFGATDTRQIKLLSGAPHRTRHRRGTHDTPHTAPTAPSPTSVLGACG